MFSFRFTKCVVVNIFSWYSCQRAALPLVFVSVSGCVLTDKLLNLKKHKNPSEFVFSQIGGCICFVMGLRKH